MVMERQVYFFPFLFSSLLFVLMAISLWKKSKSKTSTSNLPPGPRKLPFIGNLHCLIGALPHHRLRDLAKKYGPLMHLQLGEVPAIVVSSPEGAKEVLKTHDSIFAQRPKLLSVSVMVYDSTSVTFAPYGDYWRQLRKIYMMELLSVKRVESFRSIREEEVSDLIKSISSNAGSPLNLSKKIFALTYRIVSRAGFGEVSKDQDEFLSTIKKGLEAISGFSIADLFPSMKFLHSISGEKTKLEKIHRKGDRILRNIISDTGRMRNRECVPHNNMVDILLNLQKQTNLGFSLTDDNIKAALADIFAAGIDTSSTTMEWAMSEMIKNPRVMEKAQAEVRQVFREKGFVDENSLHELKFLKLVIKETLRLHPPVPLLLPRESLESCQLFGYDIPVKTKVIVNAWAIGRDPEYWNEAEKFYPERFLDSATDYKGGSFDYIPFGSGRRICPGMTFAMASLELPLASLLYHFDWKLQNEAKFEDLDMTETFGLTLKRTNDLYLVPIPYKPE